MSNVLPFTRFRRDNQPEGERVAFSEADLAANMRDPYDTAQTKKGLPMVSPAHFRNNYRCRENVERLYMLGLDLDERQHEPEPYMVRIHEAMGRVRMFCYSTFSSTPEDGYKLRALVPYRAPVTWQVHELGWRYVESKLARAGIVIDPMCKDAPRGYYIWSVPPSGVYWSQPINGRAWDGEGAAAAQAARDREATPRVPAPTWDGKGNALDRARGYLRRCPPALQGAQGSRETIVTAMKIIGTFKLSDEQAIDALYEWNQTCQPPWPIEGKQGLRRKVAEARKLGKFT